MTNTASNAYVYKLTGIRTLDAEPMDNVTPGPGQIATRSIVSAISPGTELAAWTGMPPLRPTANPFPRLMGYCMVAEVTAVDAAAAPMGDGTHLRSGDRVLTHSAHRSHDLITTPEVLTRVPAEANAETASATYLFHLGYTACLKAGLTAGHRVAVIGLGTLGMTTGAVAHMSGAQVEGISNNATQQDADDFGFSAVWPKDAAQEQINRFDIIVLTTNGWDDWLLALKLARAGGRIVMLGFPGRGQDLPDYNPLASQYIYDKQLTISACGHTPDSDLSEMDLRFTLKRNMQFLLSAVLDGRLPAKSLIAGQIAGTELAQGYHTLETRRHGAGTLVLNWTDNKESAQ